MATYLIYKGVRYLTISADIESSIFLVFTHVYRGYMGRYIDYGNARSVAMMLIHKTGIHVINSY